MGDPRRLPAWAWEELESRDRRIAALEELIAQRCNTTPTKVAVNLARAPGEPSALFWAPDDARLSFSLDKSLVNVRIDGQGFLRVMARSGRLVVRPEVTNVVQIGVEDL